MANPISRAWCARIYQAGQPYVDGTGPRRFRNPLSSMERFIHLAPNRSREDHRARCATNDSGWPSGVASGRALMYVRYFDDFSGVTSINVWLDTGTGSFTNQGVCGSDEYRRSSQRCLLMTTDPGDLVFDPTCGSGTTAYVAEQWGRRWITCDTSRVATHARAGSA